MPSDVDRLLARGEELIERSRARTEGALATRSRKRREAEIVARLRARIEERFRFREPVAVHARALGVSVTALRLACSRVAGTSPTAMLDARALLEARRLLLYSGLSVGQIADAVGFEDPAYFSRFFARHVGVSPRGRHSWAAWLERSSSPRTR
jgi:AraC family transcriptional activator of pobA